jgi:hypothetical protein
VVTGAGGSGKAVLAAQLIPRLLGERAPDDPVPVRMSAVRLDYASRAGQVIRSCNAYLLSGMLASAYGLPGGLQRVDYSPVSPARCGG